MASSRKLLHLFCKVLGLFICVSVRTALADVSIESGLTGYKINIFGTISRDDATKLAQREAEAELEFGFNPELFLNSTGGDVDAAMSIGRIVRRIDGFTQVKDAPKSSGRTAACTVSEGMTELENSVTPDDCVRFRQGKMRIITGLNDSQKRKVANGICPEQFGLQMTAVLEGDLDFIAGASKEALARHVGNVPLR